MLRMSTVLWYEILSVLGLGENNRVQLRGQEIGLKLG